MAKPPSPFAGITLSDQTALNQGGPDQRLFALTPIKPPPQPRTQATLETSKVGTKEARILGGASKSSQVEDAQAIRFDLSESPYRNDTFAFTDAEQPDAIEDIKIDLRRKHDIKATKNSLVRCALHILIEDYQRHKSDSLAVKRLRQKSA